jgi:hypothetical protein
VSKVEEKQVPVTKVEEKQFPKEEEKQVTKEEELENKEEGNVAAKAKKSRKRFDKNQEARKSIDNASILLYQEKLNSLQKKETLNNEQVKNEKNEKNI